MRKHFMFVLLAVPLLAGISFAGQPPVVVEQPFGFPSDEGPSGSSYLGVDTKDITPDRVAPLHLKDEQGVEVTMVDQDAPAGKAGIKEHDVILSVNGEHVESVEQLRRLIHEIPSGRVVTIGLSRDGQPLTIKTQLASRAQSFAFNGKDFHFEMPHIEVPAIADMDLPVSVVVVHSAMRSGLMVENLTPQLSDYFGAKGGQGILVRSVEKGSLAEKAGFHAGDVIVRVNGESISDSGDFSRVLRARKANNVTVGILRDKKEQNLTFTMPDRQHSEKLDEESMALPEISAATNAELSHMTAEFDKMQPQIAMLMSQAGELSAEKMQEAQKAFAELAKNKALQDDKMKFEMQQDQMRKNLMEKLEKMQKKFGADI